MFQTGVVEKIKTRLLFSIPPRKSCRLWDNVEKFCSDIQATDDNMAHAHCMLDNLVYKHTRAHAYTHTEYVILIAFPLQQWLQEHALVFRYTYITLPVWPASWSSGQSLLTTNHEVPSSIPDSTVGIFPEGENSRGDHGLGRLVEFRFKGLPGTTPFSITTHIIGTM